MVHNSQCDEIGTIEALGIVFHHYHYSLLTIEITPFLLTWMIISFLIPSLLYAQTDLSLSLFLSDACYILSFAIIMLNTSLHNPNVKHKVRGVERGEREGGREGGRERGREGGRDLITG